VAAVAVETSRLAGLLGNGQVASLEALSAYLVHLLVVIVALVALLKQ
jgi:hypothetical protein